MPRLFSVLSRRCPLLVAPLSLTRAHLAPVLAPPLSLLLMQQPMQLLQLLQLLQGRTRI